MCGEFGEGERGGGGGGRERVKTLFYRLSFFSPFDLCIFFVYFFPPYTVYRDVCSSVHYHDRCRPIVVIKIITGMQFVEVYLYLGRDEFHRQIQKGDVWLVDEGGEGGGGGGRGGERGRGRDDPHHHPIT